MKEIRLPRLAIEITTRCNLRCKNCTVGIPTQKEVIHLDLSTVRLYLKKAFEIVDHTDSMEFSGGEPFLHEQLAEMIDSFMEYRQKFDQFLIVTNGTVPLKPSVEAALKKYKDCGVIHISDYGLYPEQTQEFRRKLEGIGITFRVDKYWGSDPYQGGWVDPGPVASHNRTATELESVFSNCGLVKNGGCWRIHKGQLHTCARSCRCSDAGYVFPNEFVDLLDASSTIEEQREKLYQIRNAVFLQACNYCNGTMGTKDPSKRVPAGEQAEPSLKEQAI